MDILMRDRSDNTAINEFLIAKQWKQAFNLCEKKLKRTEEKDVLLVVKVAILLQWPDPNRYEQGIKELELLLERKPPIADLEALGVLDQILKTYGPKTALTTKQMQTWQRAAYGNPRDDTLHTTWFQSKFDQGDYDGAQQVSIEMHSYLQINRHFG